jgi:hypothetical protein
MLTQVTLKLHLLVLGPALLVAITLALELVALELTVFGHESSLLNPDVWLL